MEAIRIHNVTKTFGDTTALNNVSLNFESGKIYGLLGRNGAGKSTLLNIISNRIFADEGEVFINDKNAVENDQAQKQIYMMSEKNLYPKSMKIKEVFQWTNDFYGCFDTEKAERLAKIFDLKLNNRVKELSTGYNSIFKLIIALCLDVNYVFLDEPVLGLDANHREVFYRLLLESYEEKQRTFIIATHLIEEISNLIEEIIIIDKGNLIIQKDVQELMDSGYSISGKASEVNEYCVGKHVIGEDLMGSLKTSYILGEVDKKSVIGTLEINKLNLQKLFIELTKKEEEA